MSDMKKVSREFLADFALAETYLREAGEVDLEEIKQYIRNDWDDPEKRASWIAWVKDNADFQRELIAMARNITHRIKEKSRESKAKNA